jgi:hypothetical protein
MPLPSEGSLKMSDINTELGRSSTSNISLEDASLGVYGSINTNSTSRPNSSSPHTMEEWRGYNHGASAPAPNTTKLSDSPTGGPCEPNGNISVNIYSDLEFWQTDQVVYSDENLETPFDGGGNWWQAEGDIYANITNEGIVSEFQQC